MAVNENKKGLDGLFEGYLVLNSGPGLRMSLNDHR